MRSQGASPGTRETDHGILVERQRLVAEDYHTQFHDEPIRKYVEDVMQEVRPKADPMPANPLPTCVRFVRSSADHHQLRVRQVRKRSGGGKEL